MSLLHLLSYVGIFVAASFVVLSLASGLLWISELIEEHSRLAKTFGIRAIYAIIVFQVLLYFTDALPLTQTLFSVVCHLVYLQNFSRTWPFISLTSLPFVSSCVLAISNHFLWFFYFSQRSRDARLRTHRAFRGHSGSAAETLPGFADVATFFTLCVWLIPLFLFLSLSANDNALPISSDGFTYTPTQPTTSRSSLFKSILDFFPRIRRRQDPTEGIIVSHTPTHSAPSSPRASMIHSTSPRVSLDVLYSGSQEESSGRTRATLRPPPKRSADEVAVIGRNPALHMSRAVSDETPVRRRTLFA